MTDEKMTLTQWRRRAEKAEARYEKLRKEIELIRAKDLADAIELCDHRCNTEQVRNLLIEAIAMIDDIRDSEVESKRIYEVEMGKP